jgi:hypothetical protein
MKINEIAQKKTSIMIINNDNDESYIQTKS